MSAADDQTAVDEVLAGNVSAFEDLVRRWQRPLVNLAYRFCRDHSRAEEMAQEAFLRAFRSLNQWRRDSSFSTWLFALATNIYRSEIRRVPVMMMPIGASLEQTDPQSLVRVLEENDRNRAVHRAVDPLPAKYRETLILFYFHDMNVAATAKSLALPEGTIKARLSRGRELLGSKLSHLFLNVS